MGIRVDLTGKEAANFDVIPANVYNAKITDAEVRESGENAKHPGSEYINWEFTIQDGEYAGRKQWTNTSLHPDALEYGLLPLLQATGRFDTSGELDFDPEDAFGADVKIKVRIKQYKGEDQNEVKRVMAPGDVDSAGGNSLLP